MLSKWKRIKMLVLVCMRDWLMDTANKASAKGSKDEAKWLRTASTFIMKAVDLNWEGLSETGQKQLIQRAGDSRLFLDYKDKVKYGRVVSAEQLSADDVYVLADFALQHCATCETKNEECELREVCLRLGIPTARDTVCEYDFT